MSGEYICSPTVGGCVGIITAFFFHYQDLNVNFQMELVIDCKQENIGPHLSISNADFLYICVHVDKCQLAIKLMYNHT